MQSINRLRFVAPVMLGVGFAAAGGLRAQQADRGQGPVACTDLSSLAFADTTIASAEIVAAGAFEPPAAGFPAAPVDYARLPAFCRVAGSIAPSPDSDIRFELWLPAGSWNGKFMQTGNGGAAGSIVHSSLVEPVARGYAVANTDTGHRGNGGDFSWAVGHPEKLTDYQYRAVHELTIVGKAITEAHYGRAPESAYWNGCSTGGRQGLKEAQRFPDDYDAIIAGAPANNWSPLMSLSILIQNNVGPDGLGVDKLGLLKEAAIAACDADDGVTDRVIAEPGECGFDPAALQCEAGPNGQSGQSGQNSQSGQSGQSGQNSQSSQSGQSSLSGQSGQSGQCLAPREVEAARRIYAGVVDDGGDVVMPGTGPGSETLWAAYASPGFAIGSNYFRNVVANDPDWEPAAFDVRTDLPRAVEADGGAADAMDPDLSEFVARGGKLIIYHGTTDGLIPYGNSVNYYESVVDTLGEDAVEDSVKLYLVPGMDHCAGGEGAFEIDWLTALERWAEEGETPRALPAERPDRVPGPPGASPVSGEGFTRPVCPYPQVATYRGSGDETDAANFECAAP